MKRRDFLEAAGWTTLAGISVDAAGRRIGAVISPPSVSAAAPPAAHPTAPSASVKASAKRIFARVKASPDRAIRTVAGLRPFRQSGFIVRADKFDDKTVIHNYGHGGGGLTLSWGTAHLAVDEALKTGQTRFAVLGCGANGLATARLLQRHGFEATIYARDLPFSLELTSGKDVTPQLTSSIAVGQWSPSMVFDRSQATPQFRDQYERALRLAFRYFQDLVGDYYGVRWIENYSLGTDAPARQVHAGEFEALLPEVRDLTPEEHPFPYPYVHRFTSMMIEPPVYLSALMRDFQIAGGKIIVREFGDVHEVMSLPEPVVMNCTGLGARALFQDEELMPVKGQLTVLLPQPEIDYITLMGDLYMVPRKDGIVLGGTHEPGVWTLEPNRAAAESIMSAHMKLFADMRV
jgi:D-amino-acid oxidase